MRARWDPDDEPANRAGRPGLKSEPEKGGMWGHGWGPCGGVAEQSMAMNERRWMNGDWWRAAMQAARRSFGDGLKTGRPADWSRAESRKSREAKHSLDEALRLSDSDDQRNSVEGGEAQWATQTTRGACNLKWRQRGTGASAPFEALGNAVSSTNMCSIEADLRRPWTLASARPIGTSDKKMLEPKKRNAVPDTFTNYGECVFSSWTSCSMACDRMALDVQRAYFAVRSVVPAVSIW